MIELEHCRMAELPSAYLLRTLPTAFRLSTAPEPLRRRSAIPSGFPILAVRSGFPILAVLSGFPILAVLSSSAFPVEKRLEPCTLAETVSDWAKALLSQPSVSDYSAYHSTSYWDASMRGLGLAIGLLSIWLS